MRLRNLLARIMWHIAPLSVAVLCFMLVKFLDQSVPVVEDFRITHQYVSSAGVVIEGVMDKKRQCSFVDISGYTDEGRQVQVKFMDKQQESTRALRVQLWGPWEVMSGDSQTISLYARYDCHFLWPHISLLTKFTVLSVDDARRNHGTN